MQNIIVSFEPTVEECNEIKKWLIEEDSILPYSGFFCNWNSIQYSFENKKMAIISMESQIIGFMTWFNIERTSKIQLAEIKPGFRKLGLGKILTDAVLKYLKNQEMIVVRLECQPSEAENAWKKIGFTNFPDVPDFQSFNNYEDGRHLYQILTPCAEPHITGASNETIELWAVEPYITDKHSPKWVWNLNFIKNSRRLALPIIAPAKYKWNICWKIDGKVIKSTQIKNFSKVEIHYDSFLFIHELP